MNKEKLVKIINKELTTLSEIVSDFSADGMIDSFEIDLALSKVKDIQHVLNLLKDSSTNVMLTNEKNQHLQIPVEETLKEQSILPVDEKSELILNDKPNDNSTKESDVSVTEWSEVTQLKTSGFVETPDLNPEPSKIALISDISVNQGIEATSGVNNEKIADVVSMTTDNKKENTEIVKNAVLKEPKETKASLKNELPAPDIKQKPDEIVNPQGGAGVIIADKFINQVSSVNDMLAGIKKNKDLASVIKDRPIRNLKSAIKLNDRIWFTNELFNKDSSLFDKTIETINRSGDLDEALAHLFSNYNWDQNQKSTINFLELVFRRFANK